MLSAGRAAAMRRDGPLLVQIAALSRTVCTRAGLTGGTGGVRSPNGVTVGRLQILVDAATVPRALHAVRIVVYQMRKHLSTQQRPWKVRSRTTASFRCRARLKAGSCSYHADRHCTAMSSRSACRAQSLSSASSEDTPISIWNRMRRRLRVGSATADIIAGSDWVVMPALGWAVLQPIAHSECMLCKQSASDIPPAFRP